MIDPNLAFIAWLKANSPLVALIGAGNIFAPVLPEGFSCDKGQLAVVVRARGGSSHPEITPMLDPSFAVECWALEAPTAKQIYGLVRDQVHGATSVNLGADGFITLAQEEVPGQDIVDPITHWNYVVAYFHLKMVPTS